MGTREQVDFILKFNDVRGGLNFLVPAFWWDEFYAKNVGADHFHQIELPETHPLEILFSCQVIELDPAYPHQPNFWKLNAAFQQGWRAVQGELGRRREEGGGERRRGRGCDWWAEGELRGALQLSSPQISWSTLEDMGMKEMKWQVVCPQLYRMLTDQYPSKKGFANNTLTAIPVFVDPQDYIPSMPYILDRDRTPVNVTSFSFNRPSFLFCGYVENDVTVGQMLGWVVEGLRVWSRLEVEEQRNSVYYYDGKIYYEFFDGGVSLEGLGWESFSRIGRDNVRVLLGRDIVEYAYWMGEWREEVRPQPTKRVKIASYVEELPRRGFSKCDRSERVEPMVDEVREREVHYGEIRVLKGPPQPAYVEIHSSTEGETPEEKQQKQIMRDSSRIGFRMFRAEQVEEYRKMSEKGMSSFISILQADPQALYYPRQTIGKAQIECKCNRIRVNQLGVYEQVEEVKQSMPANEKLTCQISEQMQKLISQLNPTPNQPAASPMDRRPAQPTTLTASRGVISPHIIVD